MRKVKIFERVLYSHYVVIERGSKVLRYDRKSTLDGFYKLSWEMLAWFEQLNKGMRNGPFYNIWLCRDRGNRYEFNGFCWNPGTMDWVEIDSGAPDCVESLIPELKKKDLK